MLQAAKTEVNERRVTESALRDAHLCATLMVVLKQQIVKL
jgi:hypothetical protein